MKKILDKMITGFFVTVLGVLWFCSTKYHIKPNHHTVIIYDIFGKQTKIDEIRTDFKTHKVAQSYILEYQQRFPQYHFSMSPDILKMKRRIFRIFRKD